MIITLMLLGIALFCCICVHMREYMEKQNKVPSYIRRSENKNMVGKPNYIGDLITILIIILCGIGILLINHESIVSSIKTIESCIKCIL